VPAASTWTVSVSSQTWELTPFWGKPTTIRAPSVRAHRNRPRTHVAGPLLVSNRLAEPNYDAMLAPLVVERG
jgi:hypothetical protein